MFPLKMARFANVTHPLTHSLLTDKPFLSENNSLAICSVCEVSLHDYKENCIFRIRNWVSLTKHVDFPCDRTRVLSALQENCMVILGDQLYKQPCRYAQGCLLITLVCKSGRHQYVQYVWMQMTSSVWYDVQGTKRGGAG